MAEFLDSLFKLPLEFRLGMVFALGLLVGTQVNHGIYRLAWNPRKIGPWSPRDEKAPPRQWVDYLPVVGWFTLRREAKIHGDGFWLRPATIELVLAGGLTLLYWWEVEYGLIPFGPDVVSPAPQLPPTWVHAQFLAHAILICLMTTASFIDVDEKIIPDEITVLGALAGLALAAALPCSHLPAWNLGDPSTTTWINSDLLYIASPNLPPQWFFEPRGLALGVGCFVGWWLAIVPAIWTTRFGLAKAVRYKVAGIMRVILPRKGRRYAGWVYLPILTGGLAVIVGVWATQATIGLWHWHSLLTALVGMAAGGMIVWGVRIVGTHALKMEAMGFGDVTLVAMIGAFLGWQPCLMLFFVAPFIGVIIAVLNWIVSREIEIWYGPFLCLGALIVVVFWASLWSQYGLIFSMGMLVPALVVIMFALIWAMLIIWRFIKIKLIFGEEFDSEG